MAEPIRCGTTLEDGTGDNLDLRRLRAGGGYVLKVETTTTVCCSGKVPWRRGGYARYLDGNLRNEFEHGVVAGLARPPRTREEASNGGCGEAPARLVCSDSVFLIPSDRSCFVATPNEGVCLHCSFTSAGSRQSLDDCKGAVRGSEMRFVSLRCRLHVWG